MRVHPLSIMGASVGLLCACGNVDSAHLIFGQQQTVGLSIAGSAPEQDAELTLGYKDKNIAVIPVAVKNGNKYDAVGSSITSGNKDSFSTIGQFELQTGKNGTASVGLGKFFATGSAAQTLSQGFADKLSGVSSASGGATPGGAPAPVAGGTP